MIHRQIFSVDTDTGTWTDSGASFNGRILQTRWDVTTGDTGADLAMWLQVQPGDTGNGVLVVNDNDILGSDFTRVFKHNTHNTSGNQIDTGDDFAEHVVAAGEHLRVKVTPGGAAVVGRLVVWTGE